MKNTLSKNICYEWLINYIPQFIKKTLVGVKDEIMSLSKTITTDNYSKQTRVSNVYGGRKKLRKPKMKKTTEGQNDRGQNNYRYQRK